MLRAATIAVLTVVAVFAIAAVTAPKQTALQQVYTKLLEITPNQNTGKLRLQTRAVSAVVCRDVPVLA